MCMVSLLNLRCGALMKTLTLFSDHALQFFHWDFHVLSAVDLVFEHFALALGPFPCVLDHIPQSDQEQVHAMVSLQTTKLAKAQAHPSDTLSPASSWLLVSQ